MSGIGLQRRAGKLDADVLAFLRRASQQFDYSPLGDGVEDHLYEVVETGNQAVSEPG